MESENKPPRMTRIENLLKENNQTVISLESTYHFENDKITWCQEKECVDMKFDRADIILDKLVDIACN